MPPSRSPLDLAKIVYQIKTSRWKCDGLDAYLKLEPKMKFIKNMALSVETWLFAREGD